MSIQIEKTQVSNGLANQTILLYGMAKVGKTTTANQFPKALFLATEAGHSHLECDRINCNSWNKFLEACALVAKGEHEYQTIIIDTIDNLVDYCTESVCKENGISYPSELAMGRGWALVTSELKRAMMKLASLPYTLVMISHSTREIIETSSGKKYDRWTISVSGKNKQIFLNMSDLILFIDFRREGEETKRIIKTRPSPSWQAGDRSGRLPEELPLSYTELKKHMEL